MPAYRADCQDCPDSYTDPDIEKVSAWAEDHESKEIHDVEIERATAERGA